MKADKRNCLVSTLAKVYLVRIGVYIPYTNSILPVYGTDSSTGIQTVWNINIPSILAYTELPESPNHKS